MHVVHEIYKTRVAKSGRVLGTRVRDSLDNAALNTAEFASIGDGPNAGAGVHTSHSTTHLRCPSCFQSHLDEDDCCSSCADVREAFRKRGWNDRPVGYTFSQCIDEAYAQDPPQLDEGCRVEATLHVRKVPATVHIGVGRHLRTGLLPASQVKEYVRQLDFSHDINQLTFGPDFPGLVRVLEGRRKQNHQPGTTEHYQYDIHVIPTRFKEDGSDEVASHQYSVTEYVKPIEVVDGHQDSTAAGLWMSYDFTPFEVQVTRSRKSLWHFLTECCAILGGIFAFTGMLDNFAYQINRAVATNSRRGGARAQLASMDVRT